MNPRPISVWGIVLAAGSSSRMGTPKALLEYRGSTFLHRALDALRPACTGIVVVTAPDADRVRGICREAGARAIVNAEPERGMLSSLQCALAESDADAFLFTPVDFPALDRETPQAIVTAFRSAGRDAVVPVSNGRHGHPVCISRALAQRILALPEGASARDAIHDADVLYLPVSDPGILVDVDTPADYQALAGGDRK